MKYFTASWYSSEQEDHEIEENLRNYETYINNLYEDLPFVLKLLTKSINLHDGILRKISFLPKKSSLVMEGIFGDLQRGYFNLEIEYSNITKLIEDILISIFKDKNIEILSDEIELVSKDLYSHTLLFSTKKEIEIIFSEIAIKINPASPKDYKNQLCELIIG